MDHLRSTSGNGEDNCGIPEDLRCKRSDGKQWRCSAMSMPDKTVCEKHYIQAKKRAANSALRASLKKAKRKSLGEGDIYLESKSDDLDSSPFMNTPPGDYPVSSSGKKHRDKMSNNPAYYSPETTSTRSLSGRNPINDELQRDASQFDENMSYKTPLPLTLESSRNRSQRSFDASAAEHSDGCSGSSDDTEGPMCHQCRRSNRERVIWCLRCDRRGYCDSCISTWYSDIPLEEIERVCPACRGTCNCKVCLRGDNLVKVRIREIPPLDKLQYFHSLLSSVLPVIKQIHYDQCSEVELERRIRGIETDFERAKLNADEQMCCNLCRIPIIDYHRHCWTCSYDLCLNCCQDLREASIRGVKLELVENKIEGESEDKETLSEQVKLPRLRLNLSDKFPNWKLNDDGSIMCPPKEYGGCGFSSLTLRRIFKLNWVAKLVKNVEEIVSGCKVYHTDGPQNTGLSEDTCNNHLYCPSSQDLKSEGIGDFRKHWARGEPVIVQVVSGNLSISSWDPMIIWREIQETTDEKMKDDNRIVKAIDCLNSSEIEIELGQFIKGYSEGRIPENGRPKMLKLKDWPSPAASEEFLLYHRPEFVSKLPLLEYIHSKWGLLNVAAKLPHYSLQNDVGPKIFISYGINEELGCGDSVSNLHFNMRDMVYLLVHTCDAKLKGWQQTKLEKIQKALKESDTEEALRNPETSVDKRERSPDLSLGGISKDDITIKNDMIQDQGTETSSTFEDGTFGFDHLTKTRPGATWDVFRRQDVPKLIQYLRIHMEEFEKPFSLQNGLVTHHLHDDEAVFLNRHHKTKLKEEFGVEPWSFEQHLEQAVFIPAGCPFQVRNLQSTVQLGLDFVSPESLGEAVRLAEEIRCLPNDHVAKLQMLEVGKISLYAASSAIKEVQKLVLDPKIGTELGFEDPNLTAAVSENLEKMIKRRQIACV